MPRAPRRLLLAGFLLTVATAIPRAGAAAETFTLDEPATATRSCRVAARLTAKGEILIPAVGDKATRHKLSVLAYHVYAERRLPGAGRDAEALRSLREYEQANSKITVGEHTTYGRLPARCSRIVAQGRREGSAFYSPAGPLTRGELDLLQMSGDSLPMLGLLPPTPVEVGETWNPESWVPQMLTNTEAVLSSRLTCRLASVEAGRARVTFEGRIDGATLGASSEITLSGEYIYDLNARHIARWELRQREKRSVGGVSPGFDAEATVTGERTPITAEPGPLTDAVAARIPLEPTPEQLELRLDLPWGVQIRHGRQWHVFQQTDQLVLLRLMDRGSLLGQCNISRIPSAAPGKHLSEEQFQDDIRSALGDRLEAIESAEPLPAPAGHVRYRIRTTGRVKEQPFEWIYYLCAHPDGRQVALLFTVEPELRERLGERDVQMVESLQFIAPTLTPAARDATK